MPVESAADRLAFLDSDEFAVEATYMPTGGGSTRTVLGIFDSDFIELDVGGEVAAASRRPVIRCRIDDLTSGGREGDTFAMTSQQLEAAGLDTNAAGTYRVMLVQPDGTGFADMALQKQ